MTARRLEHLFVEQMPERLEEGVLYISISFTTALHLCACGCRSEVVTPLSPTDWSLTFDGESVSLSPSVGSWSLPCRSHYWIDENRVRWAGDWSDARIEAGRAHDRAAKRDYFEERRGGDDTGEARRNDSVGSVATRWTRIRAWFRRLMSR